MHSKPGSTQALSLNLLIAHSGTSLKGKILCDREFRNRPCVFNLHTNASSLADSDDSRVVRK